MISERNITEYKKELQELLHKNITPPLIHQPSAKPTNNLEVTEYHKWALQVSLNKNYNLKSISGVLILPFEFLKSDFLKRYKLVFDKPAIVFDETRRIQTSNNKVVNGNFKDGARLYKLFKLGQEDSIFNATYTVSSFIKYYRFLS